MASVEVTVCPNWINNFCPLGIGAIIGGVAIIEQTEVKKKKSISVTGQILSVV